MVSEALARRFIRLAALLTALLMLATPVLAPAPAMAQFAPQASADAPETDAKALPPDEAKLLTDLLKDDEKRAALIAQLERAGGGAKDETAEKAGAEAEEEEPPLGAQIAEISKSAVDGVVETFTALRRQLLAVPVALANLPQKTLDGIGAALVDLALVIAVTAVIVLALRSWLRRIYRRLASRVRKDSILRTLAIIAASVVLDTLGVLVAAAAGYFTALFFDSVPGGIALRHALYLNAFVAVGLARVAIRAILTPNAPELRLVSIPDRGARIMSRWFGLIAAVLGYGQLLIAPSMTRNISWLAGNAASILLALVAILIAAGLTLYGRRPVANWLAGGAHRRGFVGFICAVWYIPALLYLAGLFVIVATRPDGVFWPVLFRSAQVLAVVVGGVVVSGLATRLIARGVTLPDAMRERLPMLERRLNRFVPRALSVIRILIVVAVICTSLDALGVFDVGTWLRSSDGGQVVSVLFSVALTVLVALAIWIALASWVDFRLSPVRGVPVAAREQTLLSLMKNALTVLIIVLTIMFVLSEMGVNIAPLIASAGVFGLAIGFGAQAMVQDIITGVFIQFENAMNVGDVVTVNGTTGVVEKLTIRSVSLRDLDGCFHIIPFSSVGMVSNYTREYGYFLCDMGIAYRENVADAKAAMHDAFDALMENDALAPSVIGGLEWFGVQELAASKVIVRARIKSAPGMQWAVGRGYNEIVKQFFDARGIEIAFPHQTLYFGVDKNGDAPPLHVVTGDAHEAGRTSAAAEPAKRVQSQQPREYDVPDSPDGGDGGDGR